MTGTGERIRWEAAHEKSVTAYFGYAGTPTWLFQILRPVFKGEPHALTTMLPGWPLQPEAGTFSSAVYGTPDELKAEAERWLKEFVLALGAVFPGEDGEPLEVKYAAGRRVRYAHPDYGYPGEKEHAAGHLTPGEVYTIAWADIGQSRTDLNLRGVAGRFNSVFFEPADDEAPDEPAKEAGQ